MFERQVESSSTKILEALLLPGGISYILVQHSRWLPVINVGKATARKFSILN